MHCTEHYTGKCRRCEKHTYDGYCSECGYVYSGDELREKRWTYLNVLPQETEDKN